MLTGTTLFPQCLYWKAGLYGKWGLQCGCCRCQHDIIIKVSILFGFLCWAVGQHFHVSSLKYCLKNVCTVSCSETLILPMVLMRLNHAFSINGAMKWRVKLFCSYLCKVSCLCFSVLTSFQTYLSHPPIAEKNKACFMFLSQLIIGNKSYTKP